MADGFGIMNLFGGDMSGLNELLTPEQRAAMQRQGALSMAAQLLAASGPSRTPVSLGQALGQSYMAGQKGYTDAQQQALTGMLTKQKIQEYKQKLASREAMNKALESAAGGAPMPAAGSLTTAQQALAAPGMPVGPTRQRAAMVGAPARAMSPGMSTLGISQEQAQGILRLPESERAKAYSSMLIDNMKFGEAKPMVMDGQTVMVQTNAFGQQRVAPGLQPYEALPSDVRTAEYLTGTPLAGTGVSGATVLARSKDPAYLGLTEGQKAVDKKFAETNVEWLTGQNADVAANAAQVATVLSQVEAGKPLTGPAFGALQAIAPDFLTAIINPQATNALEQIQEVAQRNLKIVLGAQFAQKEGEQLIRRAYNPALSPAQNAARLRRLFAQIQVAAQQKQAMVEYFQENGTLRGYKGKIPSVEDFYKVLREGDQALPLTSDEQALLNRYNNTTR
jgi:hypothetical protein